MPIAQPLNNASGTLRYDHLLGSDTLILKEGHGARFGTPTVDSPVRVTVARLPTMVSGRIEPGTTQTIYTCTARSGDTLSGLTAVEGTSDQRFYKNDPVQALLTAGMIDEIQDTVGTVTTAPTGLLKGVSGALTPAVANIDFVPPESPTFTSTSDEAPVITGKGRSADQTGNLAHLTDHEDLLRFGVDPNGVILQGCKGTIGNLFFYVSANDAENQTWTESMALFASEGGPGTAGDFCRFEGFNVGQGGGPADHDKPQWFRGMESNYYQLNPVIPQGESHLTSLRTVEGVHLRCHSIAAVHDGSQVSHSLSGHRFEFSRFDRAAYDADPEHDVDAATTQWMLWDQGVIQFRGGTILEQVNNDLQWLNQRNQFGTTTSLIYLDAASKLQLGGAGVATIHFGTAVDDITVAGKAAFGLADVGVEAVGQVNVLTPANNGVAIHLRSSGTAYAGLVFRDGYGSVSFSETASGATNSMRFSCLGPMLWGSNNSTGNFNTITFTERLRLNELGNLGLGTTTPVPTTSPGRTFQIGSRFIIQACVDTQPMVSSNAYYNNAWLRANTGTACAMRFDTNGAAGDITFHTSPSGAAGSTITNWDTADVALRITNAGQVRVTNSLTVGGGAALTKILPASATLNFPEIAAGASASLTISVTGAAAGSSVALGPPSGGIEAGLRIELPRVSAADTVTVTLTNTTGSPIDPASALYKCVVFNT